jgi:hypothetical protein
VELHDAEDDQSAVDGVELHWSLLDSLRGIETFLMFARGREKDRGKSQSWRGNQHGLYDGQTRDDG